ncbi:MAG: hypothetical protein K2X99_10715 [Gemmatimonadaceae bacterium]|nr:hypothetical protein [Gemmatimonadaceae bacterium]
MARRRSWIATLVLGIPMVVGAQAPRAAADAAIARARAALAPIASIVGEWEGDATVTAGPGRVVRVRQREEISWGASGTMLFIRGTGRSTDAATLGAVLFEAAATAWFDESTGRVRMQAHNDGRVLTVDVDVRPDTLVWGFDTPGGRVRYTIASGNNVFHEIGEFLRPGAPPVRTLEMTLARQKR